MAMCPVTFVVRLADRRVRHLTRIRVRARDDRVWGETLRGGCPGQDSNLHGSCLPWDFKSSARQRNRNTPHSTTHGGGQLAALLLSLLCAVSGRLLCSSG